MNKLDKRTKEYKRSKGLGDTIEKITTATGIKAVVDSLFDDCGCDKKQKFLNKLVPYGYNPRCLTEEEYNKWGEFKKGIKGTIEDDGINYICKFHASLFNRRLVKICRSCPNSGKILLEMIERIDIIYKEYKSE